jgi:hypothetical protein
MADHSRGSGCEMVARAKVKRRRRPREISDSDIRAIIRALRDIRSCVRNLRLAGAGNAARRAATTVKSVEGALRHAYGVRYRTKFQDLERARDERESTK